MAKKAGKIEDTTLVRVATSKTERAKQIAIESATKERRFVPYGRIIDKSLEIGLKALEKEMGLQK